MRVVEICTNHQEKVTRWLIQAHIDCYMLYSHKFEFNHCVISELESQGIGAESVTIICKKTRVDE